MKKFLSLLLILIAGSLSAQENKTIIRQSSFQLDWGINQLKEENLHRKVHMGLLYGLRYEHTRQQKHISGLEAGLSFSRLKTSYEALSATASVQLYANSAYLFETLRYKRLAVHLGPKINLAYNLSLFPNWDESHLYWADHLSLGLGSRFYYQVNPKQSLILDFNLPLCALVSRPVPDRQHKIDEISLVGIVKSMHRNPQVGSVRKLLSVRTKLEYQFHLSNRITQAICYSYHYARIKGEAGFPWQHNQHHLGLKLYF